jgi:hypothetical protein
MATALRTIIDFLKGDENVSPRKAVMFPNGINRIYFGEVGAPPAGAYRDINPTTAGAVNPTAGDIWVRMDSVGQLAPQRRVYICTTGGASPVWEALQSPHAVTLATSGTVTPDLSQGNVFIINGATGDITFANATNSNAWDEMFVLFVQDATGGRRLLYGTNYSTVWQPNPSPSSTSILRLLRGAGTGWSPLSYSPTSGIVVPNFTPVTKAAAVTTDQILMTFTLAPGAMNGLGRTLRVHASGRLSSVASYTGVITFKIRIGAQDLVLIATAAIATQTLANSPWELDITAITQTTGATGKLWAHGRLSIRVTAAAGPQTIYADVQTTTMGTALDLTAANALDTTVAFGTTASASNSCTEDLQLTEVLAAA